MQPTTITSPWLRKRSPLRLGFVALTDCAPLVMAQELGLFRRQGLEVSLTRELGWASIRDKVVYGQLDAAHAVGGMPVAATLGFGSIPCECLTALVLNLHGNGITLSQQLHACWVEGNAALRAEAHRRRGERMLTFGMVSPVSSHHVLLRRWLAAAGLNPDRDVRLVVVPPAQLVANLKRGNLDGFCVGEPYNSLAVQARLGVCVAASAGLDPGHPEKVLMVRRDFAERRAEEHLALVAALIQACAFCDAPANHDEIIRTLARPEYVQVPAAVLRRGITGDFDFGAGRVRQVPDFTVFHRGQANEPSAEKAAWVLKHLQALGHGVAQNSGLARRVFRADLFHQALALHPFNSSTHQHEPAIDHELSRA